MTTQDMPPMPDWTEASSWRGLRLQVRMRVARAFGILQRTGKLNRSDIQRIGEVTRQTAAADLRIMQERTGALVYDKSARCYRLKEGIAA